MPSSLYTLADLRTLVYTRLENNQLFFPPAEVTAMINECLSIINLFTGFYQGTVECLSVANQLIYSTPTGMIYPLRAQFNGVNLDPIGIVQIGKDYRDWATETTTKNGPVARWVPIGTNYFAINPMDSEGGQNIYITGVLEVPLMVDDTDEMVLDDEYVTLIPEMALMSLVLKEGGATFSSASSVCYHNFLRTIKSLTIVQGVKFPRFFQLQGAPLAEGQGT